MLDYQSAVGGPVLRRIGKCGLVGGALSLRVGLEISKAGAIPS